ncbi:efflux RND transporter permease subunit [Singulisphaera sp. PoT]|uniref:efflux RND transporter permease subunit n=1 Tax=Singulisphaera sp. PoT TaxID=3411797 RepID=UPI003BF539F2
MWIVKLALRRPYTFVVMSMLIVVLCGVTLTRMPVDIFPEINIPVVAVVWTYPGMSPDEMEKRIVTIHERAMTTTVNDIEHIESQSLVGVSVIKVFFQPGAKIEAGVAQVNAISNAVLRVLPPGITPPFIVRFSASNVPILQMGIGGEGISEQQSYDLAQNFIRTQLATVQGAQVPLPLGGKPRQVMVDLDPEALYANNLSPSDVSLAINAQNLILPAGSAKIGPRDYQVQINSSPDVIEALNDLPIKHVGSATIHIRDVAHVRDGAAVQTNIVNKDGKRGSLLTILKSGAASTIDVVARVKAAMPLIRGSLPDALQTDFLFDQSVFVESSIEGVLHEAAIAAFLTGLMILLFLGSWRSTLIVTISIPLSIMISILILAALGHTINTMTLGGMALAVGILVDDATVEIENIHRNLAMGKPLKRAILDGAEQIAVPAFVSTLAICIVFIPVSFLSGAAQSLFTPLGMAVVFAMMASYFLSRTLVPTMINYLLGKEVELYRQNAHELEEEGIHVDYEPELDENGLPKPPAKGDIFWRIHRAFNHQFEKFRNVYTWMLSWALENRGFVCLAFAIFVGGTSLLFKELGQDFFPTVDAGQIRMHVRAPSGTRLEETERLFARIESIVREVIPKDEVKTILNNIGLPSNGINLAYGDSSTIGAADGEMLIALTKEHHPTPEYVDKLRKTLTHDLPEASFAFQPADIVGQILNFGLAAPIDVQISGNRRDENYKIARRIEKEVAKIPGAVDVRVHQIVDSPKLQINVDRTRAERVGMTQRDVANSLLVSLSSSGQAAPNYWIDPRNGVNYPVAVQTPQHLIDSVEALRNTPIIAPNASMDSAQLLTNVADVERGQSPASVSHYNVQPVYDVFAGVQGRDLGAVANDLYKVIDEIAGPVDPATGLRTKLPKGSKLTVRGQVESMQSSFRGLAFGLVFAVMLVYLLMVVNFQSWLDPFIILWALPGAISGIIWMLFVTQTTLSVPSLMGAIMCIGVATANSILMVTFANSRRLVGDDALTAALAAGRTRLRPVVMTALAMIIGMLPMSLGVGEGGEQNAPLGRAVIGGLTVATFATLFFVPVIYSLLRRTPPKFQSEED